MRNLWKHPETQKKKNPTKFTDGSKMSPSTVCSIKLQEKNKNLKENWPAVTHASFMCKFIQHLVYYWVPKGAAWEQLLTPSM